MDLTWVELQPHRTGAVCPKAERAPPVRRLKVSDIKTVAVQPRPFDFDSQCLSLDSQCSNLLLDRPRSYLGRVSSSRLQWWQWNIMRHFNV